MEQENTSEQKKKRRIPRTAFPKGKSGNPGGRPKTRHLSEAYKRILEEHGAEAFAQAVTRDALDPTLKPSQRLAAIQEITDRTEGKAPQSIRVEATIDEHTARLLTELAERLG